MFSCAPYSRIIEDPPELYYSHDKLKWAEKSNFGHLSPIN
jgi:hypothetical protein